MVLICGVEGGQREVWLLGREKEEGEGFVLWERKKGRPRATKEKRK